MWSYNVTMERKVIFHTDPESGGWVAIVPGLPGCVSQGQTLEEAIANVRDAMATWLEGEAAGIAERDDARIEVLSVSPRFLEKTPASPVDSA